MHHERLAEIVSEADWTVRVDELLPKGDVQDPAASPGPLGDQQPPAFPPLPAGGLAGPSGGPQPPAYPPPAAKKSRARG